MEFRFVAPHLRALDAAGSEVLVCALFADQRPPRGVAGLVDWRMAGRLARLMREGTLCGELGETVLVPGKPRVPFEKVLLFGAGELAAFDEQVYASVVRSVAGTLGGLRVRVAVVERPGRALGRIGVERAVDLLVQACEERAEQDRWTLVEEPEDQRRIAQHLAEERRRSRMG
jgi:hypothetical protein